MVREFTREDRRYAEVVFDARVPGGTVPELLFERGVQLCAALVWRLHHMQAEIRFSCDEVMITAPAHSSAVYELLTAVGRGQASSSTPRRRCLVPEAHLRNLGDIATFFASQASQTLRATIDTGTLCPV